MLTFIMILIAVFLDYLLGDPKQYHPLAGFGKLTTWLESKLYASNRQRGIITWLVLVLPFVLLTLYLSSIAFFGILVQVLCLYVALGTNSLFQHARSVEEALNHSDLDSARQRVAMMVSRDSRELDGVGVSKAAVESVLENGNDAVFGTLFWFALFGGPGAILYRLANTLDAMWGYRNTRYEHFGWFAARMDDILNWLPARLTAITYALLGNTTQALRCWLDQSRNWNGSNPGTVMASGAGALNVKLGGAAVYHGKPVQRPELGAGEEVNNEDISRSVLLVQNGQIMWLIVLFLLLFIGGFVVA